MKNLDPVLRGPNVFTPTIFIFSLDDDIEHCYEVRFRILEFFHYIFLVRTLKFPLESERTKRPKCRFSCRPQTQQTVRPQFIQKDPIFYLINFVRIAPTPHIRKNKTKKNVDRVSEWANEWATDDECIAVCVVVGITTFDILQNGILYI